MRLVVDASVALKWFLPPSRGEQNFAEAVLVGQTIEKANGALLAPIHWLLEVVAVLARSEPQLVDPALLLLSEMRPIVVADPHVLRRAADLATALDHHLFDTLYHAVALETGATLVTADERYFGRARHLGSIAMLRDFTAGA